jgi:hypothetical protein
MYPALAGAASSALDLLSSLISTPSTGKVTTGLTQNTTSFGLTSAATTSSPALTSGTSTSGILAPQTLNALLAAQGSSQSDSLKDLFGLLDTNGDGQISKSEFESDLGAGGTNIANADSVFSKLDTNGDGSVSLDELSSALKGKGHGGHHHAHGAGGGKGGGGQDALLQALDGASSTSVTNSDGSTSTTLTYSDGSTVTLNTPAAAPSSSSASNSASSSYNLVEKMIQKQADALSLSAKQSLSVSV